MEAETFNTIMAAISTVGFPIVAFYLMYKMVNGAIKDNTEAINKNTELMSEVMSLVTVIKKLRESGNSGK